METDILGGVQLGFKTILVLSGSTRREGLVHYTYRPDMLVDSIADLNAWTWVWRLTLMRESTCK